MSNATALRAHDHAVAEGLAYLHRHACFVQRGAGGKTIEAGAGVVAMAFRHRSSRAGDPALHTHVVTANMIRAVSDGRWLSSRGDGLNCSSASTERANHRRQGNVSTPCRSGSTRLRRDSPSRPRSAMPSPQSAGPTATHFVASTAFVASGRSSSPALKTSGDSLAVEIEIESRRPTGLTGAERAELSMIDERLGQWTRREVAAERGQTSKLIEDALGKRPRDPAKVAAWNEGVELIHGYRQRRAQRPSARSEQGRHGSQARASSGGAASRAHPTAARQGAGAKHPAWVRLAVDAPAIARSGSKSHELP